MPAEVQAATTKGSHPVLDGELHREVLRAMDGVRPSLMIGALRRVLAQHLNVTQAHLFLSDYQLSVLRPVGDPGHLIDPSSLQQAFTSQALVSRAGHDGRTELFVPLTVRGDRIGVLQLTFAGQVDPARLPLLQELGTLAAYLLRATDRQTDLLQRDRRSHRFTLAAELQWQLVPAGGGRAPEYDLAGHLEPAHNVFADNFDWSQDDDHLLLSVVDSASPGRRPPLMLTTLTVTAMRHARRLDLPMVEQASMADQAVYSHFQGMESVGAVIVSIDLRTGRCNALRAGSPQLLVLRAGSIHTPALSDQPPLGMFEGTDYDGQDVALEPGDRLLLVSDGVHAPRSPADEAYGVRRLPTLLVNTSRLPSAAVVRCIIDDLSEHQDGRALTDDAAVICMDWHGHLQP